jgi:hypothetical protein
VCSCIGYSSLSQKKPGFLKKWGSLFYEFNNDKGFWSSQYYFFYFTRRLVFLLSQVYLNDAPFVQGSLLIGSSLMQLGFLMYYRPFNEIPILVSNIAGEISSSLTIMLSYLFLFALDESMLQNIEMTIVFAVIGGMGVQIFISLFCTFKSFKLLWRKIIKTRAHMFIKASKIKSTEVVG